MYRGADDGLDDCIESDNVLRGVQEITSDLKSTPLQTLQEVKVVEQGAGVLQGAGVISLIQCDPGFVTKNEKFPPSNSTGQGVTSVEQGAGVLQGVAVENEIQCDPEILTKGDQEKTERCPNQTLQEVPVVEQGAGVLQGDGVNRTIQYDQRKIETKWADEKKVKGVQEKTEQECMGTELVEEIQYEQDFNEMKILTEVQGDNSVQCADDKMHSEVQSDTIPNAEEYNIHYDLEILTQGAKEKFYRVMN